MAAGRQWPCLLSVARICHAAVSQLRAEAGGDPGPAWDALGEDQRAWYGESAERAWRGMIPCEMHAGWAAHARSRGWPPPPPWDALHPGERLPYRLVQMIVTAVYVDLDLVSAPGMAVTSP